MVNLLKLENRMFMKRIPSQSFDIGKEHSQNPSMIESTPEIQKPRHCEARSNLIILTLSMLKLLPASFLAVAMTKSYFSE